MFKIEYFPRRGLSELTELTIELIGSFSIDGDLQYHADLSQLKYYIPPSDPNNVYYDLDYDAARTHHKPGSYVKLDDILRWILGNFNQLEKPLSTNKENWLDIDFVCRRGALTEIFCTPYNKYKGWVICASKYRGTIYLCQFYTDEGNRRHAYDMENKLYSRGFKFEQYMVADHPSHKPDLSVPLNECEEFRCVFKTKFGNHSLVYAAEIDGICSQQPIENTLIGKKFKIIEMKTLQRYNTKEDLYGKLSPYKVARWWSQNYLAGINTTVCGLKVKNAVTMIKEYPTHILPRFSKVACDVDRCKMFGKIFLNNVKRIVIKDHNECMYKFQWNSSNRNIVHYSEQPPNNEMYLFLKSWFVNGAEEHRLM